MNTIINKHSLGSTTMSVLLRRFTILALTSALFALAMTSAVQHNRPAADRYQPIAACSPVSATKCLTSL